MPDVPVIEVILQVARRQLMFVIALATVAVVVVSAVNGWSWTTALFALIAIFIAAFAWALTSFWIWVFRKTGRPGGAR